MALSNIVKGVFVVPRDRGALKVLKKRGLATSIDSACIVGDITSTVCIAGKGDVPDIISVASDSNPSEFQNASARLFKPVS